MEAMTASDAVEVARAEFAEHADAYPTQTGAAARWDQLSDEFRLGRVAAVLARHSLASASVVVTRAQKIDRQTLAEAFMAAKVVLTVGEMWAPPMPAEAYAMADVAGKALGPYSLIEGHVSATFNDAASLTAGVAIGTIVEDQNGVVVKRVPASEEGPDFIWKCGLFDYPETTADLGHLLTWPVEVVRFGPRIERDDS